MNKSEIIHKQKELIEQYGILFEKTGLQPVAGRIAGLLLVMDKETYTFDEIVEELNISKSTASVAIKTLLFSNEIEYITHSGDRKKYFRTKITSIEQGRKDFISLIKRYKKLTEEAYELKQNKDSRVGSYFSELLPKLDSYIPKLEELDDKLNKEI
ncbi:MAG: hypothetical protein MI739_14260 [Bacteroidales bacterium]|nr:hypothetical protein [Bacteroidales bacterium]